MAASQPTGFDRQPDHTAYSGLGNLDKKRDTLRLDKPPREKATLRPARPNSLSNCSAKTSRSRKLVAGQQLPGSSWQVLDLEFEQFMTAERTILRRFVEARPLTAKDRRARKLRE